jgi:hypothetical protein
MAGTRSIAVPYRYYSRQNTRNPRIASQRQPSSASLRSATSITAINVGHTTEQPVFVWGKAPRHSTCYACEVSILDNRYYITNEDNAAIGTIGGEYG